MIESRSLRCNRSAQTTRTCDTRPFICDLTTKGVELRIEGYVAGQLALTKSLSSDRTKDQFVLVADDDELLGDGSDATRVVFVVFRVVDRYGAPRPFAGGEVAFDITAPGVIVGDNPFQLTDSGGVGAVWIKTHPKSKGKIVLTATHSQLGEKLIEIKTTRNTDFGL